jgi:hypothetical protein
MVCFRNISVNTLQKGDNDNENFSLEQATRAQRGSRGIALLFP